MESSDSTVRVVLADDHHFFREGLHRMLVAGGMAVVGETADGAGAIALARELTPDIVVLDLQMPGLSGADAIGQITASDAGIQIVVVTVSADEADVLEALSAGACGYLLKDMSADELVAAVRLAAGGHAVLSRAMARALVGRARTENRTPRKPDGDALGLSARELAVIRLIVSGADNAGIGRELAISRHTVKQHVTNIFEKLGVQNRVQAAVFAVREGLV